MGMPRTGTPGANVASGSPSLPIKNRSPRLRTGSKMSERVLPTPAAVILLSILPSVENRRSTIIPRLSRDFHTRDVHVTFIAARSGHEVS